MDIYGILSGVTEYYWGMGFGRVCKIDRTTRRMTKLSTVKAPSTQKLVNIKSTATNSFLVLFASTMYPFNKIKVTQLAC